MLEVNPNLKEKNEQSIKYLLKFISETEVNKFIIYRSNPAKYPQIIDLLNQIKEKMVENKNVISSKEYIMLSNILEDELAFALLIIQKSKCDPIKFIKF